MKQALIALSLVCIILTNCTYENEEEFMEQHKSCDPVNVSYTNDVLPIITSRCYSCHDRENKTGGVDLEGYDQLKKYASKGDLVGVITHASGYPPMPAGGSKLSKCNIQTIQKWIDEGTLNN